MEGIPESRATGTYVTKTRSVIASGGADLLNQFDSSRTAAEA